MNLFNSLFRWPGTVSRRSGKSWVNPKLQVRDAVNIEESKGLFAIDSITKDEVLIVWSGRVVTGEEALAWMSTPDKHYLLQIGEGFYQVPFDSEREAADFTNHSCDPNAGFGQQSPIVLSAMRPIAVGEEIVFDYAMCETDERLWPPMECKCGTHHCRGRITANDYRLESLQKRYQGYWSPHIVLRSPH